MISQIFAHVFGLAVPGPAPVHGPGPMEKPTLGGVGNCQSPPSCPRTSLQGVKKPEIDIPQMHHSPERSGEASCWNVMHLGDVDLGKFDLL